MCHFSGTIVNTQWTSWSGNWFRSGIFAWLFFTDDFSSAFYLFVFLDLLSFGCWTSRTNWLYFLPLFFLFLFSLYFCSYLEEFLSWDFQLFYRFLLIVLIFLMGKNSLVLFILLWMFLVITFLSFIKSFCISYKKLFQDILPFFWLLFWMKYFFTVFYINCGILKNYWLCALYILTYLSFLF